MFCFVPTLRTDGGPKAVLVGAVVALFARAREQVEPLRVARDLRRVERVAQVVATFWRDLVAFAPVYGAQPGDLPLTLLGVAALAVGALALRSLAAARAGRPDGVLGLVLGGWLVAASVLLASQRVWFSRELYPFVPIFALWLAVGCRDIVSHATGGARAAWLAPPVALLLVLALHSPAVQGPDALRLARWQETQAVLEELGDDGNVYFTDDPGCQHPEHQR